MLPFLRSKYKVKSIHVFGSYARGQAHDKSDLDILVEFSSPTSLFKFMELEDLLSKELGVKVDLVSKKALKKHIGKRILKELVSV